jgi:hypothetical protein
MEETPTQEQALTSAAEAEETAGPSQSSSSAITALPSYHIALWDTPGPMYVCLLCLPPAPHLPLEAIQVHIPEVHGVPAIPTETTPMLLTMRLQYDAEQAAAAQETVAQAVAATATITPTPEEARDGGGAEPDAPTDV